MKKAILLNSYVGDQLKTLVTSDYAWSVSLPTEHKATRTKSSTAKVVKKKASDK